MTAKKTENIETETEAWAVTDRYNNRLDGKREWFIRENCVPVLFRTNAEARIYIEGRFGYLRTRPDLWVEPFGWRMPRPERVRIVRRAKA